MKRHEASFRTLMISNANVAFTTQSAWRHVCNLCKTCARGNLVKSVLVTSLLLHDFPSALQSDVLMRCVSSVQVTGTQYIDIPDEASTAKNYRCIPQINANIMGILIHYKSHERHCIIFSVNMYSKMLACF